MVFLQDDDLDHDGVLLLAPQFIIHDSRQGRRFSPHMFGSETQLAVQCIYGSSFLVSP
jgi:hypothetical protein